MTRHLRTLLLVFLLIPPAMMAQLKGKVVAIADGDTFTLLTAEKKQVKVRLHGIDCPEKNQEFGTRARQFTSALIFGKFVTVQLKKPDRYGRTVGIVRLQDGRILNELLLQAGLAWHFRQYDKSPVWAAMAVEAKRKKLGLWSMPNPEEPSVFRKSKKKKPKSPARS
jgi:endonuclease YncB( thermonuclease family)